jgi:ArsR family transcriptional regulator
MLQRWAEIFHVLGNYDRLRVLSLFLYHNDCLCACEAVDALDLPQYQVAKHLYILKKAKLLSSSRDGRWAYYCLTDAEETHKLVDFLRTTIPRHQCEMELTRLRARLAMRVNGRCVIGPPDHDEPDD